MLAKNNKQEQLRQSAMKDKRFGLKKLSVGLASVALGTILFLGQANVVNAEKVDSDIEDNLPDDFTDEEAAERRAEEDILLSEDGDNIEAPAEKTIFQFSYMEAGTGEKMDGFFGEYVNANEAEEAFRMYANEAGYTLENIQFNNNSFTATIAPSSTDRYVEAAKGRARNLISGLDGLTDELKADYLEQVGAAVSVEEVEAVYNEAIEMATQQKEEANRYVVVAKDRARQLIKDLTNLTNDQKTHYLAKVEAATSVTEVEAIHAEAENVVNETPAPNRFVKIARDHARQLINKLGNLYDNQKADYIKRVDEADSVKAIEGILEEAQKHVNSAKGGENGQAPTQPDKPSYDGDMTPTPEAPAESELDQAKMKATEAINALGYFTAKEKQDLLGRVKDYDNTGDIHFIVTKAQQENNKRDQLHRKLLELQLGTNPNDSLPETGKSSDATPEDFAKPEAKFDLKAYKVLVKNELKDKGFENTFVFDLIDKAMTKEGVDTIVESIDLRELIKLNKEYGKLEQKVKDLSKELEALINEVVGKEEVAQEDLDGILKKVNEIRENLDKMQKHINILPEELRMNAQATLDQVKELLNEIEKQYSYEDQSLQYLKDQVISELLQLGAPKDLIEEIQNATSTQVVRQLAGEFERHKEISARRSSLETRINNEVTHDGQKAKLLKELVRAIELSQLEELENKVDREIAFGEKRKEIVEAYKKWNNIISNLEKDINGSTFTTETQHSDLLELSDKISRLITKWEELAKGDTINEAAVDEFKRLSFGNFDKDNIPSVVYINELNESLDAKITGLVLNSDKQKEFKEKLSKANNVKEIEQVEKEVDEYLDQIEEKEEYANKLKSYISKELQNEDIAASYHKIVDQVNSLDNYKTQFDEILELALIENMINTAKYDKNKRELRIKQATSRLSNLSYESPDGKELPAYLQSLSNKKDELDKLLTQEIEVQEYRAEVIKHITVGNDPDLKQEQINYYVDAIKSVRSDYDYKTAIDEIINLYQAEKLLEKAKKSDGLLQEKRLKDAQARLDEVKNSNLLEKKKLYLKG